MEDASFVEIRGALIVDQALEGWIWAEEREKGVVEDEERFGLGGFGRDDDLSEGKGEGSALSSID